MTNQRNKPASSAEITSLANFYSEMSNNLKEMVQSTTTLDEKIKALVETQDDLFGKIERLMDSYNNLLSRITNVEAKDLDNILSNINTTTNRLSILENEIEILDDLSNLVNKHVGILAVYSAEAKSLKSKLNEQSKTVQDLVIKMERVNIQKNNIDKVVDYLFKAGITITIAYIIYLLGIDKK